MKKLFFLVALILASCSKTDNRFPSSEHEKIFQTVYNLPYEESVFDCSNKSYACLKFMDCLPVGKPYITLCHNGIQWHSLIVIDNGSSYGLYDPTQGHIKLLNDYQIPSKYFGYDHQSGPYDLEQIDALQWEQFTVPFYRKQQLVDLLGPVKCDADWHK